MTDSTPTANEPPTDLNSKLDDIAHAAGASFYSLPITKQLLPYSELGMQGDVGRHLRYPDDVLSTLSHLTAMSPEDQPGMLRLNPNNKNALYVENIGGGGGGGPGNPWNLSTVIGQDPVLFNGWYAGSGILERFVYGWNWAVVKVDASFFFDHISMARLMIGHEEDVTLAGLSLDLASFTDTAGSAYPKIYSNSVWLANPIDLQGTAGVEWRPALVAEDRQNFIGQYTIYSGS